MGHLQVLLEKINEVYQLDWDKAALRHTFTEELIAERLTTHYIRRSPMKRNTYLDCVMKETDLLWAKSTTVFHVGDLLLAVECCGLHSCPALDRGKDLTQFGPDSQVFFVLRPWVDRRRDAPRVRGDLSAYGEESVVMTPTKATRVVLPHQVIQRLLYAHACVFPPPEVLAQTWGYAPRREPLPAEDESEGDVSDGDGDEEMKESTTEITASQVSVREDPLEATGDLGNLHEDNAPRKDNSVWDALIAEGMDPETELTYALSVEVPSDGEQSEYEVTESDLREQQRDVHMEESYEVEAQGRTPTPSPPPAPSAPKAQSSSKTKSKKPKRGPAAWKRLWAARRDSAWRTANARCYGHALAVWCDGRQETPLLFREVTVGKWCGSRWLCSEGHGFDQMGCQAAGCNGDWVHWHRPTQDFRVFSVYQGALCKFLHGGEVDKFG